MNDNNKNIIYTAKDIEMYLGGRLSADEMHAMEKAALDDPFLAEAMEGFEAFREEDWNSQLAALHLNFIEGRHAAKIIPIKRATGRIWRMVAASIVIIFGTAITWWLSRDKSNEKDSVLIAQQADHSKDTSPSLAKVTTTVQQPAFKTDSQGNIAGKTEKQNPPKTFTIITAYDSGLVYTPPKYQQVDAMKQTRADSLNDVGYKTTDKIMNNASSPVVSNNEVIANIPVRGSGNYEENVKKKAAKNVASDIKSVPLTRSFIAQVVGPDNSPLPFANISISNENFGTYADAKGNFRLISTDSLLNIEVKSIGYLPRSYTLRSSLPQNKIILREDEMAFLEKTVIKDKNVANRKPVSRRATLLKDSVVNVEPADGWDNYGTYIANNIDIPDDNLKKIMHGEVLVSFDVKPNGAITNVKVDDSNCNNCGEVAKRVIEQGPQWKVKKGKKASARIMLQF